MVKRAWTGVMVLALAACAQIAGIGDPSNNNDASPNQPDNTPPASVDADLEVRGLADGVLDFGTANCGDQPKKYIEIHNSSSHEKAYTVSDVTGPFQVDDPSAGRALAAGATATITVTAKPDASGQLAGNVSITTKENVYFPVSLRVTGAGATLDWSSSTASFGDVRRENGGTTTLKITNTGSVAVSDVTFGSTDPTNFPAPASINRLAPSEMQDVTITLVPNASDNGTASLDSMITPSSVKGLCGTQTGVHATGRRVNTAFTVSNVDFGNVLCNDTVNATKTVTLSNYNPQPVPFTVAQANPSSFTVDTTGGSVPGATGSTPGTAQISVMLKQTGATPGPIDEQLTINTTQGANSIALIAHLGYTINGAVFVLDNVTPPYNFTFNANQQKSATLRNNGNRQTYFKWQLSDSTNFDVSNRTDVIYMGPKGQKDFFNQPLDKIGVTMAYKPQGPPGPHDATLKTQSQSAGSYPICNESSFVVNLQGN